jgi:predicted O-linked N-acetylglucosamine transferase (SPINDLY family)
VIPPGEADFYSEKIVLLPHAYQVNDKKRAVAGKTPPRREHGLPGEGFVFCNFNQSYKITPASFAAFMRIMRQAPESVLWLLEANPVFHENLKREAASRGVAAERLVFAPVVPLEDHLARMSHAHLFLDTLPYNAHTTASDALWAGLPLLTCRGAAFPGRVSASLLNAVGLPELVTENEKDFEALAVKLAREPELLLSFREKLARIRDTAPLFDTDLYRRHIEAAYKIMWQGARAGAPVRGFAVEGSSFEA